MSLELFTVKHLRNLVPQCHFYEIGSTAFARNGMHWRDSIQCVIFGFSLGGGLGGCSANAASRRVLHTGSLTEEEKRAFARLDISVPPLIDPDTITWCACHTATASRVGGFLGSCRWFQTSVNFSNSTCEREAKGNR